MEERRYHLYLAAGCPFCHRLLIALRLLGLEEVVSHSFVDDERDGRGWAFRARHGADPVNGFHHSMCATRPIRRRSPASSMRAIDRVFGLCSLLGFRFAPRIRDLADRRLYVLDARAEYKIRDRTFENQSYRASGLNLAFAAIILWNTVYLGCAVDELRSRGETIPDELVAHVAPLGWEHIAFNGDYVWPDEPLQNTFRPLRPPAPTSSMQLRR